MAARPPERGRRGREPQAQFGLALLRQPVQGGPDVAAVITNTGTVTSDTADPAPGNNAATAQTLVTTLIATPAATRTPPATPTATATPPVALSIDDVTQVEGAGAADRFCFTATLSALSAAAVRIDFRTAAGKAAGGALCLGGADYRARSGTLVFAPGSALTRVIDVFVCGDATAEGNETLFVDLSNPVNATLADSQGVGTIVDDD